MGVLGEEAFRWELDENRWVSLLWESSGTRNAGIRICNKAVTQRESLSGRSTRAGIRICNNSVTQRESLSGRGSRAGIRIRINSVTQRESLSGWECWDPDLELGWDPDPDGEFGREE